MFVLTIGVKGESRKALREKLERNMEGICSYPNLQVWKEQPQLFWPLLWRNDACFGFGAFGLAAALGFLRR
jgi:hypothetical protein